MCNHTCNNIADRKAWIRLGNMSKEDTQKELVQLLYKAAPQLEDYVSQQWKALKLGNTTNGKMCVNPYAPNLIV